MTESVMFFSLAKWWSNRSIVFVLFCLALQSQAQIIQTSRFEIPLRSEDDEFEIVHAGIGGLYLTRRTTHGANNFIQLIKLDTALQHTWSGFLPIDMLYKVVGKRRHSDQLYILSRSINPKNNDLVLYVVNEHTGNYTTHRIRSFIPFAPSEFQVTEKCVLVGGQFNNVPVVVHYDLASKKSKVLPAMFNEAGELNQIKINEDGSFDVLISARNLQRQITILIKSYDAEGNLLINNPLGAGANYHLLFGRSIKTNSELQIVAGVFGNRNREYSKGMFIATIDPSGHQNIRYFHYGDLKNFFKYMKAKREQRVKSRIERKKIKGKRARFMYRFLVHELILHNDQYILLGEAFYPKYRSVSRSSYGFFSSFDQGQSIRDGRIFDGYFYTHAVVMAFNKNGDLLWDNSFEINDVKTFTLEQFVKLHVLDDRIALAYQFQNQILTKIIKDDQVLEGKTSDPIATFGKNEFVKKSSSDNEKLEYWYDDYLFASGSHEVVNKTTSTRSRKVFYINKLTFEK